MRRLFSPNINGSGRLARGVVSVALFIAAGFGFVASLWLGLGLAAAGFFVLFEALRGWCALRACGIKTRL